MDTHRNVRTLTRGITATAVLSLIGTSSQALGAVEASPDFSAQLQSLHTKIDAQQAEIETLRRQAQQRASSPDSAEVDAVVRQVIADADARSRLLSAAGANAGYKEGFFIAADDDSFALKINGEGQIRYVYTSADERPASGETDEDESGFQIRRSRIAFSGNFINPKLTYRLRLGYDRGTGNVQLDDAWVAYALSDELKLTAGQFKPQFIREEIVSGFSQLAAERSYAADYYTVDYTQGAELGFSRDSLRAALAVHDGSYALNSDFDQDRSDVAFSGRVETLLAGDWKQFSDFTSFSKDELGILIGAGVGYEVGETGAGSVAPDVLKYSVDASAEFGGANLFAAAYGQSFETSDDAVPGPGVPPSDLSNLDDAQQWGFVAQGGVFVVPDKLEAFGRYEWIDLDGVYYRNSGSAIQGSSRNLADDELSILTAGVNYYFVKHSAKLTLDVQYALDPVPVSNTGGGLLRSGDDGQIAVRAQFQYRF